MNTKIYRLLSHSDRHFTTLDVVHSMLTDNGHTDKEAFEYVLKFVRCVKHDELHIDYWIMEYQRHIPVVYEIADYEWFEHNTPPEFGKQLKKINCIRTLEAIATYEPFRQFLRKETIENEQ